VTVQSVPHQFHEPMYECMYEKERERKHIGEFVNVRYPFFNNLLDEIPFESIRQPVFVNPSLDFAPFEVLSD